VKKLIAFFSLLYGVGLLAHEITEHLGYLLDDRSFWIGIVAAGLMGFVWFLFGTWSKAATAPYRCQTVMLKTRETPNQIMRKAALATFCMVLLVLAIVAVIAGLMLDII
jgi:hypothetical protein